ncbi:MAG: TonB-dependent receptor plug domain-containing protein, partial [Catalinimonas sp.]
LTAMRRLFTTTALLCGLITTAARAQTPPDSLAAALFYDMTLEQLDSVRASGVSSELEALINSLVSVSTSTALSARNSPSVVTVVTREEILASGARDLIDVLRLVPGYHLATDADGRVGIGIRGNWANEGKVLMRIDGQEVNDIYRANILLGNHYLVDDIERIEVIRGPGSAIYGGFAEFGVIDITTRRAAQLDGFAVGSTLGWMEDTYGRRNGYLYFARDWGNWEVKVSQFFGDGQRSDQEHFAFYQDSLAKQIGRIGDYHSLAGQSTLRPVLSNLYVRYKNFSFRSISDFYEMTDLYYADTNGRRPGRYGVESNFQEFRYDYRPNERLLVTPRLNFIVQSPQTSNNPTPPDRSELIFRGRFNLTTQYDFSHRINLTGGGEAFYDYAEANAEGPFPVFTQQRYLNLAVFGQTVYRLPIVNFLAGARYEYNDAFGTNFVPRLAMTKTYDRLHFKVMASRAFRAPTIGNVSLAFDGTYDWVENDAGERVGITNLGQQELKAENTYVGEAEVGYQFNRRVFATANLFHVRTRDPIVFTLFSDAELREAFGPNLGIQTYQNADRSGTSGLELELRTKDHWGHVNVNYSFYTALGQPVPSVYRVGDFNLDPNERTVRNRAMLLGFPNHKLNVNALYYLRRGFSVNLTGTLMGDRYTYLPTYTDPEDPMTLTGELVRLPPEYLANLFFRYENLITPGLTLGAGVYNLLDRNFQFLQPYFGLEPPLPGPTREWVVKLQYDLHLPPPKRPR